MGRLRRGVPTGFCRRRARWGRLLRLAPVSVDSFAPAQLPPGHTFDFPIPTRRSRASRGARLRERALPACMVRHPAEPHPTPANLHTESTESTESTEKKIKPHIPVSMQPAPFPVLSLKVCLTQIRVLPANHANERESNEGDRKIWPGRKHPALSRWKSFSFAGIRGPLPPIRVDPLPPWLKIFKKSSCANQNSQ